MDLDLNVLSAALGGERKIAMTESNEAVTQDEETQKRLALIVSELKAGTDTWSVTQKLAAMGVDQNQASQLVDSIHAQIKQVVEAERITPHAFLRGLIGGAVAAAVGGVLWGLIVKWTDYEIGYMALGIGLLCGFGVVIFSGGRKGYPLQAIAVVCSVLGILAGKYAAFFFLLREEAVTRYGAEAAARLSMFSPKVFNFFLTALKEMVSGFDLLWVVLAVWTAWRIPKSLGIKLRT